MKKLKFYKDEDRNWFVDLPDWEGTKADLQMVAGADSMLEMLSDGKKEIWLNVSDEEIKIEEPFENLVKLDFVREAIEIENGAFYNAKTIHGVEINLEVWLCDVTLFVFGKFPEAIYFYPILD